VISAGVRRRARAGSSRCEDRRLCGGRPRAADAIGDRGLVVGTICELPIPMMMPSPASDSATSSTSQQDLRPRARTLSWMASLSVAAGELRAAEGYLLELLAWCAFGDRDDAAPAPATEL